MIDRYALLAGGFAAAIYLLLFVAYEVTQGWDVPLGVVVGLGLFVVVGATAVTELMLRALIREASKEV